MINHSVSALRPRLRSEMFWVVSIIFCVCLLAALGNQVVPPDSFLYVNTYTLTLLGKYLCFALLALSVDVIWGYCGILSLGHGAFFALGGYGMGMYLMRQIGDRGEYGHPLLPDFMVFLNWDALPWYWWGMDSFPFAILMALFVPGLLAFVFGWLAFRSKVTGVYFSIITQALTYALMLAFFRNEMGFGGNNGLTDFKDIIGFNLQTDETRTVLFLLTGVLLAGSYALSRYIMQSKAGRVLRSIRDAEARTRFLGYRTDHFKLGLFVYSAVLAGVAGVMYVPQVGIINPSEFQPLNSIEVIVWVAVGGRGTLYGAMLGAVLVNYAKTRFTALWADYWSFALGAIFVLVTLFMPRGVVGLCGQVTGVIKHQLRKNETFTDQQDARTDQDANLNS